MKSLQQYVSESMSDNIKVGHPDKNDGKYYFFTRVDCLNLCMDNEGTIEFAVEAKDFNEAKEKATKLALEKLDKIPTKIGDVLKGSLWWEVNDDTVDYGHETILEC